MCSEASASCDPIERAEPDNPSEAVGDPDRRSHQHNPRRWRRGGVRNGRRARFRQVNIPPFLALGDLCCLTQFAHSTHRWIRLSLFTTTLNTCLRYCITGQADKIPLVSARLGIAHSLSHATSFASGYQSKQNLGWRVVGAWAFSSWSCCAVTPGLRNFFRCEHDSWCHQPLRSRLRGSSSLRHQKMDSLLVRLRLNASLCS